MNSDKTEYMIFNQDGATPDQQKHILIRKVLSMVPSRKAAESDGR